MPWSSNGTFLVHVEANGAPTATSLTGETAEVLSIDAIYKPHRGERPLWDFPDGLYRREVAAFVVSEALGWGLVPETIVRSDAPYGVGSLQRFVPADFSQHYFTLLEDEARHDALRTIGTFDVLINNADRKGGHCILGEDDRVWAIDHGVAFHTDDKLRTVVWDFAGEPIPPALLPDVERLAAAPPDLDDLLDEWEIKALVDRARQLCARPRFPRPTSDRPYPWPLV